MYYGTPQRIAAVDLSDGFAVVAFRPSKDSAAMKSDPMWETAMLTDGKMFLPIQRDSSQQDFDRMGLIFQGAIEVRDAAFACMAS